MNQIRLLLFDLGNVLAFIDFEEFWRTLGFHSAEDKAPFTEGYTMWTHRYEIGSISTGEYLSGLQSVFKNRFPAEHLEGAFSNIILNPVDGMTDVVKKVSRTHRTALVSNTNDIHYRKSIEQFEALRILQFHYLSYQMHVMKPAHEFYDMIITDQAMDPSAMLFIDDLATNVEGAQAAGMHAVKFENTKQLEKRLIDLRILL
jgi:putative hydrolase of the HAD superfamily